MGCYTWCAFKSERTIEEARRLYIYKQEKFIADWKQMITNPQDECRVAYEWTQEYMEHCLKIYERQLGMVKKGLCNIAVMNRQPEQPSYYIEGKGFFINCNEHGNQFRIGGYPEDKIFSKEECIRFIESNKDKIQFFDKTYEWLDEFWNNYPDGFMHFG